MSEGSNKPRHISRHIKGNAVPEPRLDIPGITGQNGVEGDGSGVPSPLNPEGGPSSSAAELPTPESEIDKLRVTSTREDISGFTSERTSHNKE